MYIVYSQLSALIDAARNILIKDQKAKVGEISSITFTWAWLVFTLLILLPLALKDGIPTISDGFVVALIARMTLDPIAIYLYNFSLQYYKISSVLPLLSFGPVFSYIAGVLLLNELPSVTATIGIVLIIGGVYFLNLQRGKGVLDPFVQIYANRGNFYVLIAAIIWGILVPFFKLGSAASNSLFFTGMSSLAVVVVFTILVIVLKRHEIKPALLNKRSGIFVGLGLLDGIVLLFRVIALETGAAAAVSALNRTSIIFGAFIGGIFFKEELKSKVIPILVMLLGVFLIALR